MAEQNPLKIHNLRPAPGAKTAKTRVGRGEASKGKTAGRGTKGTKARYQGTGINTEAKLLMLRHAFENWRVRRAPRAWSARTSSSRSSARARSPWRCR